MTGDLKKCCKTLRFILDTRDTNAAVRSVKSFKAYVRWFHLQQIKIILFFFFFFSFSRVNYVHHTHVKSFAFLSQEVLYIRGHFLYNLPRLISHQTKAPSFFVVYLRNI